MNRVTRLRFLARLVIVFSAVLLSACADYTASQGTFSSGRPSAQADVSAAEVSRAQTLLVELGFEPGPVDGLEGPRTASAVRAYQGAAGLEENGRVSTGLVDHLTAAVERRQVVRAQSQLAALGFDPGPVDGHAGPRTRSAIEAFQGARGLTRDGRITPALLAALDGAEAEAGAATAAVGETGAAEVETPVETPAEAATEETAAQETAAAEAVSATAAAAAAGAAASQAAGAAEAETAAAQTEDKAEQLAALAPAGRTLAAGDRVLLSYLGADQKPMELEIGQDGMLAVPEAGSVEAAGLGVGELRDKVTVKLIKSYMEKIEVDVGLAQSAGAEAGDAAARKLAAGDLVRVSVSGASAASSELEIASDGSLDVPEAGSVRAAGLGLAELEEEIGVRLLESYMSKLDVSVEAVQ